MLQGGGDERRRRAALAFLGVDFRHFQGVSGGGFQARQRRFGGFTVGNAELFEFGAVEFHAAGIEGLTPVLQLGGERPVLAADESLYLVFALAD